MTLQHIADRCAVSRATVSRALRRDLRNLSAATIERILAVADEMGYDPSRHHAARRLALGWRGQPVLNRVIALFIPPVFMDEPYYARLFKGILDVLSAEGYGMLTMYEKQSTIDTLLPIFSRGDVDGAIAISLYGHFEQLQPQLRAEPNFGRRPIVIPLQPADDSYTVLPDDFSGGQAIMRHLLALGHRQIIHFDFMAPSPHAHLERRRGFHLACHDHGLDPAEVLRLVRWNFDNLDCSVATLLDALRAHPRITAIIAPNDGAAVCIYHTLCRAGKRVPNEISLVGYDDVAVIPDHSGENLLTTVRVPLVEIGRQAATLIIRHCTGDASDSEDTLTVPTELIIRSSTAPPPSR